MGMGTFYGWLLCEDLPAETPASGILLPPSDQTVVYKVIVGNSNVQAGQYVILHKTAGRMYLNHRVTGLGGNARFFVSGDDVIATVAEKDVR